MFAAHVHLLLRISLLSYEFLRRNRESNIKEIVFLALERQQNRTKKWLRNMAVLRSIWSLVI